MQEIGKPVAYHELCREFVRLMVVTDVSEGAHYLMAVKFASGFVFTAHFGSRREMDVWISLLRPDDSIQFPWGLPFEEAGTIDEKRVLGKEIVFPTVKREAAESLLSKLANVEGLLAAQRAAVAMQDNFSVRATRKRQLRIQRAMFGVLKEMHGVALDEARCAFGSLREDAAAAAGPLTATGPRRRARRKVAKKAVVGEDDIWSESDDSSNDEDV